MYFTVQILDIPFSLYVNAEMQGYLYSLFVFVKYMYQRFIDFISFIIEMPLYKKVQILFRNT